MLPAAGVPKEMGGRELMRQKDVFKHEKTKASQRRGIQ